MAETPPAAGNLVICTDPSTLKEVRAAINAMNSGKAGGANRVTAEMRKAEDTETPRFLTDGFKEMGKRTDP